MLTNRHPTVLGRRENTGNRNVSLMQYSTHIRGLKAIALPLLQLEKT